MSNSLRYNGRLPGVVVNTALPNEPAPLRLDVAGFVGFAERGPLDTPVALEDVAQYEAVFGGDLPVAREGGTPIYAALPSAVRAFFDNGGRRCYAVRVAGATAARARLAVPGLAGIHAGQLAPASVEAAWAGRWGDRLALWTQLLAYPLRLIDAVSQIGGETLTINLDVPSISTIAAGDLLRLRYQDGALAYFNIDSVVAQQDLRTALTRLPVAASGSKATLWGFRQSVASLPAVTKVERLGEAGAATLVDGPAPLSAGAAGYTLGLPSDQAVQAGDLLRIRCADGQTLLFAVAQASEGRATCVEPVWQLESLPPPSELAGVELLRFAMRVREAERTRERYDALGFDAGAGGWRSILCDWPDRSPASAPLLPAGRSSLLRGGPATAQRYLPIGMPALPGPDAFIGPLQLGDEGLASFSPQALFLDPALQGFGQRTLMAEAERLIYLSNPPARLRGLHSLIPVEEVAIVAIPDLAQRGWPATTLPPPVDPPPAAPPPAAPPDWSGFRDCAVPAPASASPDEIVRAFYGYLLPISAGDPAPGLDESARLLLTAELRTQLAGLALPAAIGADEAGVGFSVSQPPCSTQGEASTTLLGTLTLLSGVELHTEFTLVRQDERWAIAAMHSRLAVSIPSETQRRMAQLPQLRPREEYLPDELASIHAAMIRLCAARGDMTAVLSLANFYGQREAAEWRDRLELEVGLPTAQPLSYAAAYHPWVRQTEPATPELAPLRATPPDGAVCGMIAARERERGVWVAPAGIALRGAVGLGPALSEAEAGSLFDMPTQINVLRQQPGRFVALSAHTLSAERIYWQLGVRRLLILLRKAALRRGQQYVFESNSQRFRQQVQGSFERMLARIAQQGALAAYQVVADSSINTPNDYDNGRFIIALKVAPVSPVEFITVTLLRSSEGLLAVQEN